jgi:hypothetical protein
MKNRINIRINYIDGKTYQLLHSGYEIEVPAALGEQTQLQAWRSYIMKRFYSNPKYPFSIPIKRQEGKILNSFEIPLQSLEWSREENCDTYLVIPLSSIKNITVS